MDFSLYFLQLSVGVVGLTPFVPWRSVGKGYHVMMLAIGLGLLPVAWFVRAGDRTIPGGLLPFPLLALAALGAFLGGRGNLGFRLTVAAAVGGGLVLLTAGVMTTGLSPAATPLLLAFNFLAGALLLGSVLSAMLLGHWYLVVKDLPVQPLKTLTILFFVALGARLAATVAAFLLDPEGGKRVADHSFLFVLIYGLFSLGTPIAMSWMVWGTVRIRSTQAATGILYGITVFILMGEAAGRFVLIKTGFPL